MAKKKEVVVDTGNDIDIFLSSMKKELGDGIVGADDFLSRPKMIIPWSPSIDAIIGGVPEGSWVTLAGKPKFGKTVAALRFASVAQRPEYGGRHVFYLNVEGRLKEMNINGTEGLDKSKFTVIGSTADKIYSAQDYLTIAEKILMSTKKCVLIIDSYSAIVPEKEITDGIGTSTRGGGAMLLAQFCRQMGNVVPVKDHIVIGITHLQANTSGYGSPFSEKGGNAIAYQVDIKLMGKRVEDWLDSSGKQIGQLATWESGCTATGYPPGQTCTSYVRYGVGIDEVAELCKAGEEVGLIDKAGAWYTLSYAENHLKELGEEDDKFNEENIRKYKYQGELKLFAGLKENEKLRNILYARLKDFK